MDANSKLQIKVKKYREEKQSLGVPTIKLWGYFWVYSTT